LYQSVDTPDVEALSRSDKQNAAMGPFRRGYRLLILLGVMIAATLLAFAFVYMKSTTQPPKTSEATTTQASYAAYLKAIREPNAALRRARLQDFLKVYPTDARHVAAAAQLDVLSAYETRDWNYITKIAYEDGLSHAERISTLEDYSQRWGGDLLGGRTEAIEDLRARILNLPERTPIPDRRLEEGQSPIPSNIEGNTLLGAPRRAIIAPPPPVTRPPVIVAARPKDVIIPPKVSRNVTPRYPSKALRRNIEALVVLRLNVDAKGRVKLTELVEVQAPRYQKSFIKAAERAALRTRYHPQTRNGEAVPVSGIIKRYRFKAGG